MRHDGRWMYDGEYLLKAVKAMPDKRRARIYLQVINIMESDDCSKIWGIAKALRCHYDDRGFWWRKTKITI